MTKRHGDLLSRIGTCAFTVVELLCVLALLGLIAAITFPTVAGVSSSRDIELAARGMAMDIRRTQQKAITAGWTQYIEFRTNADDYRLRDGRTEERTTVKLPPGVTYRSVNFPIVDGWYRQLSFNRSGAPNRGGTVALTNNAGDVIYIIVTPATGRVRISDQPPENW